MDNTLVTALVITAIGMSLLFLSLVLFYGIISLLTAITRERAAAPPGKTASAKGRDDAPQVRALQAAAIAIALARAEAGWRSGKASSNSAGLASGDRDVTPWWSLHHQQRLADTRPPRRLG